MTSARPCLLVAVLLAWASVSHAQAGDTVYLQGGGRLRGMVEEYVPGERVVILLPSGERRTIQGPQVERVEFGTPSPPPAPVPPATAPPATAPPATAPPATAPPATQVGPAPPQDLTPPPPGPSVPGSVPSPQPAPPAQPPVMSAPAPVAPATGAAQGLRVLMQPAAAEARFSDGRSEEVPWVNRDEGWEQRPDGWFHLSVQASGGGQHSLGPYPVGGYGDLALLADFQARQFHFRIGFFLGAQDQLATSSPGRVYLTRDWSTGAFTHEYEGYSWIESAIWSFGLRASLGAYLQHRGFIRFGGDIGGDNVPGFTMTSSIGRGLFEVGFRALDDGRLEIGAQLAPGITTLATQSNAELTRRDLVNFRFGLIVGSCSYDSPSPPRRGRALPLGLPDS